MDILKSNDFIFSARYRAVRHIVYWLCYLFIWAIFWSIFFKSYWLSIFITMFWLPVKIIYSYPLIYYVIPNFLFKARYVSFVAIIIAWGVAGWFINFLTMAYIIFPVQRQFLGWNVFPADAWQPASYLCLLTAAAGVVIIKLFGHWVKKQQDWMQSEKEKISAELQLLKAQVHPHFLFNTLNNIYSFSLENSPKTPGMILKLSSLLSYMLYDCKAEEVLLEKEIEVMKNYIDLEKERYGNKIEISLNIEGDVKDKYIAPLLLLPFLENAFKHGTSEQLEKPWLSMDITVKQYTMKCKIVNSKNEFVLISEKGIGIENVKKRLAFLYPGEYELKINDEGEFYVVSLLIRLVNYKMDPRIAPVISLPVAKKALP
ncbi:MAG TPA: sensor histidine kinase [Chitinophagaceae bacterium]|nr:sensor histidine kinase [Chitinophagaceae bacterium]